MRWGIVVALICVSVVGVGSTAHARPRASFSAAQELVATSTYPGNTYVAGVSVVLTSDVAGDFTSLGGSTLVAAPVEGDLLVIGGSLRTRSLVKGDARVLGGTATFDEDVAGDVSAFGYRVTLEGKPGGSVLVGALEASVLDGATGPVTVYGNTVTLGGTFATTVTVISSGRVTLAPGTVIHGSLVYEAPERASIPESAVIEGGVKYTNASYLPDIGTSRVLVLLNLGFFLFVRFFGALLLAGLVAGLFPRFATSFVDEVHDLSRRQVLLTTILGFGILVATPIALTLLLLTFVGIGLAMLIGCVYTLLIILSLLFGAILVGGMIARRFSRRETVLWRDGVIGMLVLLCVSLVPYGGPAALALLTLFVAGHLLHIFYRFAFAHDEVTPELL